MPAIFNAQARVQRTWAVAVALLLVYVVWGTTYFAIGIALQTMPPLLMNAIRFLCAGGVMLLIALMQGHALPTAHQWRNSALVGGLMVFLAMNLIGFAQKLGIGSGLMATVVTTMPMWLALWSRWGGERVPSTSWIGFGRGLVGGAPGCTGAGERRFVDGLGVPAGLWNPGCAQCLPVAVAKHLGCFGWQLFVCESGRGSVGWCGHGGRAIDGLGVRCATAGGSCAGIHSVWLGDAGLVGEMVACGPTPGL